MLLDPNHLSDDGTVALGGMSVSRDGRYLAWSTSVSGSDWRIWYVRDVATGEDLPDKVEWSKFSGAAWDREAGGFYYSRYDAPREGEAFEGANYFQKLYYHRLGTDQKQDTLVYERPDQKEWGFSGQVSDDGRYLVISIWQGTSRNNRLFYKDLAGKSNVVRPLFDAFDASYEFIGNDGAVFYVKTNREAPREPHHRRRSGRSRAGGLAPGGARGRRPARQRQPAEPQPGADLPARCGRARSGSST